MQKDRIRRREVTALLSAMGIILSLFSAMPIAHNNEASAVLACENLDVKEVVANGDDGVNKASNTIDNNLSTRWAENGKGSWIRADLGEQKTICSVDIAWYKGYARAYYFTISVSSDGSSFTQVYSGKSSSDTVNLERYDFADVQARYIKIVVNGNNNNQWAEITEIDVYGSASSSPPSSGSLTINFANVAENQVLSGSYKVVVAASDASLVSGINLYIDGTLFKTENYSPYEYTIDTTKYSDGNHALKAVATDKSGNTNAATITTSVIIQNGPTGTDNPPTVTMSYSPSSPTSSQTVTYSASASDDKGLTLIQIFVDGTSIGSCSVSGQSSACTKTGGPYTSGSTHSYYSKATDNSGLTAQSATKSFTVQNAATSTQKIMRPLWLPYVDTNKQLAAYKDVTQSYDWPRIRVSDSASGVDQQTYAAFKSVPGQYLLSVTTLDKVKSLTPWAKSNGFVGVEYNCEGGFDCGTDALSKIQQASSIVHGAGLKFVATPTKSILTNNYAGIAKVSDVVHIQAQTLQDTPDQFNSFVRDMVQKLKAANPSIIVTVQTGTGQPAANGMSLLQTFEKCTSLVITGNTASDVDGVSVWFGSGDEDIIAQYYKWYDDTYRP
jgi:hypothetical protein